MPGEAELEDLAADIHTRLVRTLGSKGGCLVLLALPSALSPGLPSMQVRQQALGVRRLDVVHAVMSMAVKAGSPPAQEQHLRHRIHEYFNSALDVPEASAASSPA